LQNDYFVTVPKLPLSHIFDGDQQEHFYKTKKLQQAIDVDLTTPTFNVMYDPSLSPQRFYFTEKDQEPILNGTTLLQNFSNINKSGCPFVGISQMIHFYITRNVFANANSCINFFNRRYCDKCPNSYVKPKPARLLHVRPRTIPKIRVLFA